MVTKKELSARMRKRIQEGIAWLNSKTPEFWDGFATEYSYDRDVLMNGNWEKGLDLGMLDLQSGQYCVLGQIGNDYSEVTDYAGLDEMTSSSLGFFIDADEYELGRPVDNSDWSLLTECWISAVKVLRNKVSSREEQGE